MDYAVERFDWKPWIVCFSGTLFFFYVFIQGNMFASIAAQIMSDFQIDAAQMAWLSSIFYLANVLFIFVAGVLLDRHSVKNMLLLTMAFCVASTFVLAYTHSYSWALLARFVAGIGSAFCFLGAVRLAASWFPPKRMALVTGAMVTMAMAGGLLSQYPLVKLVQWVGWRHAVEYIGLLGVLLLGAMWLGIKEKPKPAAHLQASFSFGFVVKSIYFNVQYLCAAAYTSLLNMGSAVFGAMMGTLYLEQRLHLDPTQASFINGLLFLGAIVGSPFMGWLSDKMGVRLSPMRWGMFLSLVTVLAILYLPVSYGFMCLLFFAFGFFTSSQVISYALVAESSSPALTARAVSVVSLLTQGGYIVYQNLFSYLLTRHQPLQAQLTEPVYSLQAYQYAAIILPIGLVIAGFCLFGIKETYCQQVKVKS